MPELPEVETVRRTLMPIVGETIRGAWDSAKGLHMQRKPPRAKLKKLIGATFTAPRRHGKYLLLDTTTQYSLLIHLGMTGRVLIHDKTTARPAHTHVVLDLGTKELRFADARRFGQVDVVERSKEHAHPALAVLGPDPLVHGIDPVAFAYRAKKKKAILKTFLLDQSVLAGVGNIYASEALWRAQLKPTMRAFKLTAANAEKLADAISETFKIALENGGTSFSDFIAADGAEGYNEEHLWVYGRAGEPCLRCKTKIKRAVHQGRATYYCPTCQTS